MLAKKTAAFRRVGDFVRPSARAWLPSPMRTWMLVVGLFMLSGCQTRAVVVRTQECARLCPGCCDSTGTCLTGEDVDACGAPGEACRACGEGSTCTERSCRAVPVTPVTTTDAGVPADAGVAPPIDAGTTPGVDAGTSMTPCPPDGWCLDGLGANGQPVSTQHLSSVWATSATDVWAVGPAGTVLHFDGTAWTPIATGLTDDLMAVWASGPADVWVSGGSGDPALLNGVIAHFDGTRWAVVQRGGVKRIDAIWGRSAAEVWFGGWNGTLLGWNGATLTPLVSNTTKDITDLTGTASRVWAVGSWGLVLEFDGTTWREVPTGMMSGLTVALSLTPSLAWVAGGNGAFATWDGTTWRTLGGLPDITMMGLWGATPSEVWSVGPDGDIHRFNGVGTAPRRVTSPTTRFLRDVHGADARNVWAVGFFGTILRYRP
jgi:hypothetical protein